MYPCAEDIFVNCVVCLLNDKQIHSIFCDNLDNCVTGKKGHKGRGKQFSNPEEIDRQMKAQRELVSERP